MAIKKSESLIANSEVKKKAQLFTLEKAVERIHFLSACVIELEDRLIVVEKIIAKAVKEKEKAMKKIAVKKSKKCVEDE